MKMLQDYFELQKKIHEFFGYVEDWKVIPMVDCTDTYWMLSGEGSGDTVSFHIDKDTLTDGSGKYNQYEIYTQRFLPKYVYRTDTHTMIACDTHCDGNKFLCIFDNSKELPYDEEALEF